LSHPAVGRASTPIPLNDLAFFWMRRGENVPMKKSTGSVDTVIGSRMRMRRMLIGMTQEKLGELLELTFQQVQKYEKGTNRISASRLVDIARILGVGIDYFYDGLTNDKGKGFADVSSPPYVAAFISTPEGLQLMRAFTRIKSAKLRRGIVQLITTIASEEEEPPRSA
jgi:transcriptional regulator with XRE-family HTH domain